MSYLIVMNYSVVIPTNRSIDHIRPLLLSLVQQTFLPSQIVIMLDQYHTDEELKDYIKQVRKIFAGQSSLLIDIIHPLVDESLKYENDRVMSGTMVDLS